jgi:5-oxoprolinase (ATP-hydrolysing)
VPKFFPTIFGPNESEGLDLGASIRGFENLVAKINSETGGKRSLDEVVYGYEFVI